MENLRKRLSDLIDSAEPKENLKKWICIDGMQSYIPKHYKRISIDEDEALSLAKLGAKEAYADFGLKLFFSQAVIYGACISERYHKIRIIAGSQYGKSHLISAIANRRASDGNAFYVAGGTMKDTENIMQWCIKHMNNADSSIKNKLLEPIDGIEKMQIQKSKDRLAFNSGGFVQKISLGENYSNVDRGNQAVGKGGDHASDESAFISRERIAELNRSNWKRLDGKPMLDIAISNPHKSGWFIDDMQTDDITEGMLVIWLDLRTSIEEGREKKSKETIMADEYAKSKRDIKRYLLCEVDGTSDSSLFGESKIKKVEDSENLIWFMGIDSAYKGKDSIVVTLACYDMVKCDIILYKQKKINKTPWVVGKTSVDVANQIAHLMIIYNVKLACLDIGFGIWLSEELSKVIYENNIGTILVDIDFGSKPTIERVKENRYNAEYAFNKRAEMHLDFAELMENDKLFMEEEVEKNLRTAMDSTELIYVNTKKKIIPKDEIKKKIGKSPDELDSALLCVHAVILYMIQYNENKYIYTNG